MSEHIGIGGAWREKAAEWIGVGGSWRSVVAEWIGVGGSWRLMWAALNAEAAYAAHSVAWPTDASASIVFNNTGTCTTTGGFADFTWLTAGSASDYEIYVSGSGDTPTGSALDTWLSLGAQQYWNLTVTTAGAKSFSGTYQIRSASGGSALASNSFQIDAEVVV